ESGAVLWRSPVLLLCCWQQDAKARFHCGCKEYTADEPAFRKGRSSSLPYQRV
ncbi:hypothetical protein AVDCRST_MAG94-383, partial [uncultured Leptolyngbya sp.]